MNTLLDSEVKRLYMATEGQVVHGFMQEHLESFTTCSKQNLPDEAPVQLSN